MKFLFLLLSALLLMSFLQDDEKSFYKTNHLKGKIAVLEENKYFVNELGEKSKILMHQTLYKFDSLGNITEETFTSANGLNFSRKIYFNDATGKVLQVDEYGKHNKLEKRRKYKYDKNGNCVAEYFLKSDGKTVAEKNVYKFDKKGNETEFNKYFEDTNKMVTKTIYKYDQNNNKIESILYKNDLKTINAREVMKYDARGNKIEYNGLNDKGALHKIISYTYDSSNNVIDFKSGTAKGVSGDLWVKSKYDDNHNIIEMNYIKEDGTIEEENSYERTYDKQGNWIKQKNKTNGGLNSIVERKITYY